MNPSASSGPVTICVASGKGGVGKTSLTVNLAAILADRGIRVLVIDGDMGLANVDLLLGISVKYTIRDIVERNRDPLDSVCFVTPRFGVLPATSGVPEMVALGTDDQEQLGTVLSSLFSQFDVVLVDTAAGIGASVLWFNTLVHHNLVVLTPDPTAITDAYALMKVLAQRYGRKAFSLVLNQVGDASEGREVFGKLTAVAGRFLDVDLGYLGSITSDRRVSEAVRRQQPFVTTFPDSAAAQCLHRICERLVETVVDPTYSRK